MKNVIGYSVQYMFPSESFWRVHRTVYTEREASEEEQWLKGFNCGKTRVVKVDIKEAARAVAENKTERRTMETIDNTEERLAKAEALIEAILHGCPPRWIFNGIMQYRAGRDLREVAGTLSAPPVNTASETNKPRLGEAD